MMMSMPDLFGREIGLGFRGDQQYKTKSGIFLTIIMVILLIVVAVHETIKVISGDVKVLGYWEGSLNDNDRLIKPKFLKLGLYLRNQIHPAPIELVFNQSLITEVPCTEIHSEEFASVISNLKMCFSLSIEDLTSLEEGVQIQINRCSSTECIKSDLLESTKLLLLDVYVEVSSYEFERPHDSRKTKMKKFVLELSPKLEKKQRIKLIEFESIIDSGVSIYNKIQNGLLYKSYFENTIDIFPETTLSTLFIQVDQERMIYTTKTLYQFKDAIALIGGLMKGLAIIFLGIIYPFREISYFNFLANQMFLLCDNPKTFRKTAQTISFNDKDEAIAQNILKRMSSIHNGTDPTLRSLVDKIAARKERFQKEGLFSRMAFNHKSTPRSRGLSRRSSEAITPRDFISMSQRKVKGHRKSLFKSPHITEARTLSQKKEPPLHPKTTGSGPTEDRPMAGKFEDDLQIKEKFEIKITKTTRVNRAQQRRSSGDDLYNYDEAIMDEGTVNKKHANKAKPNNKCFGHSSLIKPSVNDKNEGSNRDGKDYTFGLPSNTLFQEMGIQLESVAPTNFDQISKIKIGEGRSETSIHQESLNSVKKRFHNLTNEEGLSIESDNEKLPKLKTNESDLPPLLNSDSLNQESSKAASK